MSKVTNSNHRTMSTSLLLSALPLKLIHELVDMTSDQRFLTAKCFPPKTHGRWRFVAGHAPHQGQLRGYGHQVGGEHSRVLQISVPYHAHRCVSTSLK